MGKVYRNQRILAWLPLMWLVVFLALQFYGWWPHTQSIYFEDESEQLVPAYMMLKHDKKLYEEVSISHQPIPILIATGFLRVVRFENLYQLVDRIRLLMFGIGAMGAVFLVGKFRYKGLVTVILVESIKHHFLGYYLLQEPMVVYPLLFITGLVIEAWQGEKIRRWEAMLVGGLTFLVAFSWLPAGPFLGLLLGLLVFKLTVRQRWELMVAILLPTFLMFTMISPVGWFKEVVVNNWRYVIPYDSALNKGAGWWQIWAFPWLGILHLKDRLGLILGMASLGIAGGTIWRFTGNKISKKQGLIVLGLALLTPSLNVRVNDYGAEYYTGFHGLPMVAVFLMLAVFSLMTAFRKSQSKASVGWGLGLMVVIVANNNLLLMARPDKLKENHIWYSNFQQVADIVNEKKKPGERLLAGPIHGVLHVLTDLTTATSHNAYLNWLAESPVFRSEFIEMMVTNPPEWVYFSADPENWFYQYIVESQKYETVIDDNRELMKLKETRLKKLGQ